MVSDQLRAKLFEVEGRVLASRGQSKEEVAENKWVSEAFLLLFRDDFVKQFSSYDGAKLLRLERELAQMMTTKERVKRILSDSSLIAFFEKLFLLLQEDDRQQATSRKNLYKASQALKEGLKLYKTRLKTQIEKAIAKFDEAILWAPVPAENEVGSKLSIGFSNRSAAFYLLKKYDEAILDCDQGLLFKWSSPVILMVRKVRCLRALGRNSEAELVYEEAKNLIKGMESGARKNWTERLNKVIVSESVQKTEVRKGSFSVDLILKMLDESPSDSTDNEFTRTFSVSDRIQLTVHPVKGPVLKAIASIEQDERLSLGDNGFIHLLAYSLYDKYCNHCTNILTGHFLPCLSCSWVRYCSSDCRQEAWSSYHSVECPDLLELLVAFPKGHLALRVLLVVGVDQVLRSDDETLLTEIMAKSDLLNDKKAFLLLPHRDVQGFHDLKYRCLLSASFMSYLCRKIPIGAKGRDEEEELTISVKIGVTFFNYFLRIVQTFPDFLFDPNPDPGEGQTPSLPISSTLHPVLSLLNHSCNSSLALVPVQGKGERSLLVAKRRIKKGEEVTLSFHEIDFEILPQVEARREYLQNAFCFLCKCNVCLLQEKDKRGSR